MIYLTLFWTFFKIGAFTFGGGYAMIPLIQAEVEAHGWMTAAELVNFLAVSESTPGPFAVNVSTYVGSVTGGFLGALAATFGVVLPSFVIILFVAGGYEKYKKSRVVSGCMSGMKPAVVGLIASAAVSVGGTVFLPSGAAAALAAVPALVSTAVIFAVSLALTVKKLHPILVIVISAALGIASGFLRAGLGV